MESKWIKSKTPRRRKRAHYVIMMKPFINEKNVFTNIIVEHARRLSENMFGIIANRWRVFISVILLQSGSVGNLVEATI